MPVMMALKICSTLCVFTYRNAHVRFLQLIFFDQLWKLIAL